MTPDVLTELDLNLLHTLDVLLEERSVTTAARRLGRSQPAVSHALGRLREALGDALLVRQGRGLVPTPRAEALQAPLRRVLSDLRHALAAGTAFDPATSERTFLLACPDLLAAVVPDLLAAVSDAPGVSIELSARRGAAATAHADVVLDVLPEEAPGVVARPLGTVTQVVVARRGHPFLADPTVEAWCAWPHVLVRTADGSPSLVERTLAQLDRTRTVGLAVEQLLLAPHVVARSDLLFTGPWEILRTLTGPLQLGAARPPCPLPEVRVAALWAARYRSDPAHRWFRDRVVGVLTELMAGAGDPDPDPPPHRPGGS